MSTQTLDTVPAANGDGAAVSAAPTGEVAAGLTLHHTYPPLPTHAVEVRKPASDALDAHFYAELVDAKGVAPGSVISTTDPFVAKFHIRLHGDLWRCICGHWCFDMCFESCGEGPELNLMDLPNIEPNLYVWDWKGCERGSRHFTLTVPIPAGTIPPGKKNRLYDVSATFQMLDPCRKPVAVLGYQELGKFQFYNPS